ncbi:MAG TPA: malonyl-CoA decarboxylase [Thermoleophilaceae bacterium]|nr:malonyl-CoA decarboxylase [Thermoleophilaceae bacterium]
MNKSFFQELLGSVTERGRALIDRSPARQTADGSEHAAPSAEAPETLESLCHALLSGRGEASGVALARQVLDLYAGAPVAARLEFFRLLARDFGPDQEWLRTAWAAYDQAPTPANLGALLRAVEPPRQELFRRLNLTPGGTAALVGMREDLLKHGAKEPGLASVDDDLVHLLYSWFNRGFLVLRHIDWSTPADILERIIRYEAVHTIQGWDDLRRRVQPSDRRCFGFFHPSLVDEPLIFVEVALTGEIPGSIQELLAEDRQVLPAEQATTAVFYSISNCQEGLRGISFGNFLIKQVVEELARDLPGLHTFVTLSPAPGFGAWLQRVAEDPAAAGLDGIDTAAFEALRTPGWHQDPVTAERLRPLVLGLAAHYYLRAKGSGGKPVDPVARFHLGNGARLERLNWLGDTSEKGLREAAGLMVNYLYDLRFIEANHEAFANHGTVVASDAVRRHLPVPTAEHAPETAHV